MLKKSLPTTFYHDDCAVNLSVVCVQAKGIVKDAVNSVPDPSEAVDKVRFLAQQILATSQNEVSLVHAHEILSLSQQAVTPTPP